MDLFIDTAIQVRLNHEKRKFVKNPYSQAVIADVPVRIHRAWLLVSTALLPDIAQIDSLEHVRTFWNHLHLQHALDRASELTIRVGTALERKLYKRFMEAEAGM